MSCLIPLAAFEVSLIGRFSGVPRGLGSKYYQGEGVVQDYALAIKWIRMAAEQGLAEAQTALGLAYRAGRGVPRDDTEAARWFRLGAEQGDSTAQFTLGNMHLNGQGVSRDDAAATKWFRLAAEQAHSGAQYNLGNLYFKGRGVERNALLAYVWFSLASRDSAFDYQGYANEGSQAALDAMSNREAREAQRLTREWQPKNWHELKKQLPTGAK